MSLRLDRGLSAGKARGFFLSNRPLGIEEREYPADYLQRFLELATMGEWLP